MEVSGNSAGAGRLNRAETPGAAANPASGSPLAAITSASNCIIQPAQLDPGYFPPPAVAPVRPDVIYSAEELFKFLAEQIGKPDRHHTGNLRRIEKISMCCKTIAHYISNAGDQQETIRQRFYCQLDNYLNLNRNSNKASEWLPYIARYIGPPPDPMLDKMTDSVFSRQRDLMSAGIWLHSLAAGLTPDKPERLVRTLNKSLRRFNIAEIFHSLVDKIHLEFWNAPFDCETTQGKLKNYFELFMQVINRSAANRIEKHFAYDSLRPLQVCTSDDFLADVYHAAVVPFRKHAADIRNLRSSQFTLEDDILFTLVTCLSYPPAWGVDLAERFRSIISLRGADGNIPIATLYFIHFANRAVSKEYSMEMFHQLFKVNIKPVNFIRAMTILFVSECISYRDAVKIYNSTDEEAAGRFSCWWQRYKSLQPAQFDDEKCLAVSSSAVTIKPRAFWDEFIPGRAGIDLILPAVSVRKWLDKCQLLENIICRDEDFNLLLVIILTSLPADRDSITATVKLIVAANSGKTKALSQRLQKLVEEFKSDKSLVYPVVIIQIALLEQEDGINPDDLISNIINNLAAISRAFHLHDVLNRLTTASLSLDDYLHIITQLLIKNSQLRTDTSAEIVRNLVDKSCYGWLSAHGRLDKLFSHYASLPLQLPLSTTLRSLLAARVDGELLALPAAAPPGAERQALAEFLLSRPEGWNIFADCCKQRLTSQPTADIDFSWAWNATRFSEASLPVMMLMLQFPASVLASQPDEFIWQCLEKCKRNAADPTPLIALCHHLQQTEKPADFTGITATIIELCEQQGVSHRLTEALRNLLSTVDATSWPDAHQRLSAFLASLVVDESPYLPDQQIFNHDTSADEISEIRKRALKLRDVPLSASASEALATVPKDPSPQSGIKLYSILTPEQLHDDQVMNQALHEGLKLLMLDGKLSELNFHAYKNEGERTVFCTFDIKPKNLIATDGKLTGGTNARGMLLQGSNNRYIVLGAENHKRAKKLSRQYFSYSENDVDALIGASGSQYQRLKFNRETAALERVEQ